MRGGCRCSIDELDKQQLELFGQPRIYTERIYGQNSRVSHIIHPVYHGLATR